MVVATTLVISAVFITLMTSLDLKRTKEIYNFLLFTSEKTRQPQESKRCNRILKNCTVINHEVLYGTRLLPRATRVCKSTKIFHKFPTIVSAQNKLTSPGGLFGTDTKMKLLAFVFFTFLSCKCLRFGQFQISRSTLCFTLPPKIA